MARPEHLHLFDTEAATTTCFETYHFADGFEHPEPERWYPGPPPNAVADP